MEQAIVYIGIDVAKAHLDVSGAVQCRRFSNERSGHVALVRWLKTSQAPMQLICEASGGYEQALLESLAEEHGCNYAGASPTRASVRACSWHPG